jgi:uncharacterized membrane protein
VLACLFGSVDVVCFFLGLTPFFLLLLCIIRQALVEILLLSGGTPYANFKDLAHAWGREKGFHHVLAGNVCDRRGEVERKRRSDAGKTLSSEQRESFRQKLKRSRSSSSVSDSASGSDEPGPNTMTAPTTMEVEEGDVKQEVTV